MMPARVRRTLGASAAAVTGANAFARVKGRAIEAAMVAYRASPYRSVTMAAPGHEHPGRGLSRKLEASLLAGLDTERRH